MAERDNSINNLDSDRWNRLDDLASQLERSWRKGPVDLASILPDEGDPLRPHALRELVKVDMEMRWRKGEPAKLDYYVETYKELGPLKTLPPTLIFEEYRVRQLFGDRPELQSYQKRFPTQYPDLQKILTEQPLPTMQPGGTNAATELHTPGTPTASMKVPTLTGVVLKQMGGHRLISRLGSGAFGEVWKAEAPGGIMKAVKVIFRPIDHEEARRELESLELIKNLRHHFLLSTHSFLPIEDRLYILMDLADCSVRDRLRACVKEGQSGIPLLELIKYLREAAEALDYLHEKGVQHRDVKPENILVCEGVVRVADFGLARSQVNRQLTNGSGTGTPVYMPPEAWNDKIHQNSDQYSLAATYAECRVARRLFDVEGIPRLMAAHLTTTPALEGLSEPERKVLHRALSKNPDHRYPSCVAFAEALEEAVAPQLPEGALKRFARGSGAKRLSARDRGLIAGGIALLLVAAATLGYVFWPRVGDLELATNNPSVEIAVLETQPLSLSFNRNGNTEPIVLTAVDPPPDIKLGEPVAESESVTVPITVNQDAAFGERELTFNAAAGDRTTEVKAKLKIVPLRTLPRPTQTAGIYLPAPGTDVVEVGGRLYYRRIECRLGPPSNLVVRFRFIPWTERGKSSFYIMEDKVTNALYGEFARENPGAVSGSRWRLGARLKDMNLAAVPQTLDLIFGTLPGAPNWQAIQATEFDPLSSFVQPHWPQPGDLGAGEATWPVLRVDVQEAARFAEWMGGLLPSVEQWDKAAGRFEKNPGIGPFREGFGKDDIAIGRADRGPLPVGVASHDVSVFGVRDMAGNGLEWTRSLLRAGERSEFIGDVNRVPLDAAVPLRGRDFSHEEPLDFASLDEGGLHVAFWQGTPDRNRTCAYESRIGFRIILP